ncbi:hypothetical protein HC248_00207 [Polaromonas vacuolata]|uniref:Uncharacterized protein n=1 Tax=Polaromonas vacuolata TaxID=37448 RepID=A0A6H2H5R8_9BURK|nr:hypothetical protein [Polaromonas vacuolata]QJC54944.1 hypothetical protein HC248_00207 [Polaromonas vacuolata]
MITNSSSATSSSYKTSTTSDPSPTKKSENPSNFSPDENTKSYFSSSKNLSLPPLSVYQSANEETLADLESVNKKIIELDENKNQSMTDIFALMALFNETGRIMKSSAFMQREANFQQQIKSLENSVVEMKNAATERFAAGMTAAAFQGAGSLAQIGLSTTAFKKGVEGANAEKISRLGDPTNVITAQQSTPSLAAASYSSSAQAAGGMGSAFSSGGSAIFNNSADAADQAKVNSDTKAKVSETAVARSDEAYRAAAEIVADTIAKMRDIVAALDASISSLNRNI